MTDPLEKAFMDICADQKIYFVRPEKNADAPSTLDFYLPEFHLAVEVKGFHTPRIWEQIERSQESNIMVLIGIGAVRAFGQMMKQAKVAA